MAKRNNKPEQATNGGAGNESTATPVDESAQTTDLNAAEDCAQALANEAFTAHPHINKVWVDEKKGEWHLVKRHGLKEFNRP